MRSSLRLLPPGACVSFVGQGTIVHLLRATRRRKQRTNREDMHHLQPVVRVPYDQPAHTLSIDSCFVLPKFRWSSHHCLTVVQALLPSSVRRSARQPASHSADARLCVHCIWTRPGCLLAARSWRGDQPNRPGNMPPRARNQTICMPRTTLP
ncbi:hypothetical protein B0T19DRAFT_410588 [Cercophora scortea]|uniref:Uncharacterized protein n=1 Tax=Cercophora scortea TaxID=314031 RepID=A0AAE0J5A7_9PEZI|nr:hypothetical protein B0T19DRAFT_410588 [Cercophora scortea]